jgi:tRNA G18 (ribose-2'-O)-methylase SpoU
MDEIGSKMRATSNNDDDDDNNAGGQEGNNSNDPSSTPNKPFVAATTATTTTTTTPNSSGSGIQSSNSSRSTNITRRRIPRMHLVITNISKRPNIRALLLNAAAFGCESVLLVGQRNFDIGSSCMDPAAQTSSSCSSDVPGPLKDYVSLDTTAWDRTRQERQQHQHQHQQRQPAAEEDSSASAHASFPPSITEQDPATVVNSNSRLVITRFEKWNDCCQYMSEKRIRLVGVEIHKDAVSMEEFLRQQQQRQRSSCSNNSHDDTSTAAAAATDDDDDNDDDDDVAFIMGNEGQGLHAKQMASCEAFIRLPQYGVGTASFNVYVAASLVLHRFHTWQLEQQQQQQVQQAHQQPHQRR